MREKYLHEVLPFLEKIEKDRQKQFEDYFSSAPLWLIELLKCEEVEAGKVFIRENEPADTIYFVGEGRVKATDYRVSGVAYDFMKPTNVIALGGMEVILGFDHYKTTLQTETKCTMVKLPRSKYEKWLCSDVEAFRKEAKITCFSLLEEERRNRLFLFFQGEDRLALLLLEWYEKLNRTGTVCITESRQSMADETGLCLKSVSRSIKKMVDAGLISKRGNHVMMDAEQYHRMKEIIDEKSEKI